jgi:hypothetical protein
LIILLAILFLGYELSEACKENRDLVLLLLQTSQQEGSEEGKESYRKGPVKNTIVKQR